MMIPDTSHTADFSLDHHGSIVILFAHTDAARAWVEEHVSENRTMWGQDGIVVEPRYIADIVAGITEDGLTVERGPTLPRHH
jgi:hypothetical protein